MPAENTDKFSRFRRYGFVAPAAGHEAEAKEKEQK
jgi:hypothetical protein